MPECIGEVHAAVQPTLYVTEDIDSIVDPDAHAERRHGQSRDLQPYFQERHECEGEGRDQRQRQHHAEHAADRTEGQEAEHADGAIDPEQHLELGISHEVVGRRHDAKVPGGKSKANSLVVMPGGIPGGRGDHPVDGLGTVIGSKDQDGHDGAVGIEERRAGLDRTRRLHQCRRRTRKDPPFRVSLVEPGVDPAGNPGQGQRGSHPGKLGYPRCKIVNPVQDREIDTGVRFGLDDHREDVHTHGEEPCDRGAVTVVPGFGAQLGHSFMDVADRIVARAVDACPEHDQRQ